MQLYRVGPVSYTHLDVYKRQDSPLWDGAFGKTEKLTFSTEAPSLRELARREQMCIRDRNPLRPAPRPAPQPIVQDAVETDASDFFAKAAQPVQPAAARCV